MASGVVGLFFQKPTLWHLAHPWLIKLHFSLNALLQLVQVKAFSPVCVSSWLINLPIFLKTLYNSQRSFHMTSRFFTVATIMCSQTATLCNCLAALQACKHFLLVCVTSWLFTVATIMFSQTATLSNLIQETAIINNTAPKKWPK